MKLFSPVPIYMQKFSVVQMGLLKRKSPLNLIIPPFGLIRFTPVQVSNIRLNTFDARVLFNPYPHFEINAIQNSFLPYAYDKHGNEVDLSDNYVNYKTQIDQYLLNNIKVSCDLDNYDILLCTSFKYMTNLAYLASPPCGNGINTKCEEPLT